MTHSAPVLKLGRLPSLKEREQDAEEHGGTVLVSRQYLEGFLASLPHLPFPGPGDSTAASGEPDDELHVHVQDLKLAGSRMPGHRFARDRLVKVLLKQCRASGLSNLLDVGMDTTGFYAALHVDHALEVSMRGMLGSMGMLLLLFLLVTEGMHGVVCAAESRRGAEALAPAWQPH